MSTTNEVPSRKLIVLEYESPKPVVNLIYLRKPRKNKNFESVSKTEVIKTISANKQEPSKSWGSTKTNVHYTSLQDMQGLSKSSSVIVYSRVARSYRTEIALSSPISSVNSWACSPICLLSKASKTKSGLWHLNQDVPSPSNSIQSQKLNSYSFLMMLKKDNHDIGSCHMGKIRYFGYSQFRELLLINPHIRSMQEELYEFERLEVWELVPPPDKAFVITLKWIYKVKLDELGGILKNKARLVARGYRQEEGIDFEESFATCVPGISSAIRKHLNAVKKDLSLSKESSYMEGFGDTKAFFICITAFADADHVVVKIHAVATSVEAMPKSAWTEKDQIDIFLKERRYSNPLITRPGIYPGISSVSVEVLSEAMHKTPSPDQVGQDFVSKTLGDTLFSIDFLTPSIVDIEKVDPHGLLKMLVEVHVDSADSHDP
ncbi:retrovirus-related pol polyprotein from transposon TNT 1-94 [Tanacetum coccineum]